jgi:hypothetical protein
MTEIPYFTETIKNFGGAQLVFCVKCKTEHGTVVLRAPTLEKLIEFYNYSAVKE